MKRILAILLVFCMVLPFAACNGGKDTPEETKNNQTPNGDVAFNEQEYLNSLPIINFDGEEFKVLCTTQTASEPENFFDVFEETSDVVVFPPPAPPPSLPPGFHYLSCRCCP